MNVLHAVEALLFVSDAPTPPESLANALDVPVEDVVQALQELGSRYDQHSGLKLIRIAGGYQLCTRSELAEIVAKYLKPQKQRLSRSLMEVLAIIAYKQPVTSAEIDGIRGVQSDYAMRQLTERRLIRDVGRKSTPGRPLLYGTTQQFLHVFGLNDLNELPKIEMAIQVQSEEAPQAELF